MSYALGLALLVALPALPLILLAWHFEARAEVEDSTILMLLRERGELYGLDLVAASDGLLGKGTVYVRLHRLEERGLVTSREERDDERAAGQRGLRRRLYSLAPAVVEPTVWPW